MSAIYPVVAVRSEPGSSLDAAAGACIHAATMAGTTVWLIHNGIVIPVKGTDTVDDVYRLYYKEKSR